MSDGRTERAGARARVMALTLLCALLVGAVVAPPANATSPRFEGLLDLAASSRGPALDYNDLGYGETPFDGARLRGFVDAEAGTQIDLHAQFLATGEGGVRLYGAYATWTPWPERDLHLQAGQLPWAVGTWGTRSYSDRNPLIGVPLLYSHPTPLPSDRLLPDADALVDAPAPSVSGSSYDSAAAGERGMRIVHDLEWDMGATLLGSARPFEFALGVVNGSPGAPEPGRDSNGGKTVLGRLGVLAVPGFLLGVSGAWGPYLDDALAALLPAGRRVTDYHQRLAMADATLEAGHLELRAEGAINIWETAALGELRVSGGYLEGRWTLAPALYGAARWDALRFSHVIESSGRSLPWDHDLDRIEAGLGYRIDRRATLKAVVQRHTIRDADYLKTYVDDLIALQLSLRF
jgi:hypothetical protein